MNDRQGPLSLAATLGRRGALAITLLWGVGVVAYALFSAVNHRRDDARSAADIVHAALSSTESLDADACRQQLQRLVTSHERLLAAAWVTDTGEVACAWPADAAAEASAAAGQGTGSCVVTFQRGGSNVRAWRVASPHVGRAGVCVAYVRAASWASACLGAVLAFAGITLAASLVICATHARRVRVLLQPVFRDLSQVARTDRQEEPAHAPACDAFEETCALRRDMLLRGEELAESRKQVEQLEKQMRHAIHHREKTFARSLEKTRRETLTDPLTGLYNRRFLDEDLPRILGEIEARGGDVTMVMIDLDHFKQHNDCNGHEAGDELLKFVGELLRGATRDSDFCIRYGGDEFALVMPDTPQDQAVRVIDRIVKLFAQYATVFKTQPRVSMSAGVASSGSRTIEERRQLIKLADRALYQAKHLGKNRVTVAA
ncbi:MAG: GGDEF domain-containing protein [Phycisphaerales bacterium]|nr:GGDEF domain-containing protein [Phycisphaerales bacterium]